MKKLSIIIVSYNAKAYVEQCILSVLAALRGIDGEVILVDNASVDGTVDAIAARYPQVVVRRNALNEGFAKANNQAIRATESEYVLLLNPDTLVGEDVLRRCLAFMGDHTEAGAAGVRMLQADGRVAMESRRGFPTFFSAFCKFFRLHRLFPHVSAFNRYYLGNLPWDVPGEIEVVSGAFMLLRRSALEKVGLLDEDFFMYGEDIDMSYRLKKAGYSNWYLPYSILHYKGQSTRKTSYRYVHVFYGAMLTFVAKHYQGIWSILRWPLRTLVSLMALLALLRFKVQTVIEKCSQYLLPSSQKTAVCYALVDERRQPECEAILKRHALEVIFLHSMVEIDKLKTNNQSLIGEEQARDGSQRIVVFEPGYSSVEQILAQMAHWADHRFVMGVYWPEMHQIITPDEIFTV